MLVSTDGSLHLSFCVTNPYTRPNWPDTTTCKNSLLLDLLALLGLLDLLFLLVLLDLLALLDLLVQLD